MKYNDYNNDGSADSIDREILEAFVEAQSIYSTDTPTLEQVQEVYDTFYVDAKLSPMATIVRVPGISHSDFNEDSSINEKECVIFKAFLQARVFYRTQTPTLEQVQERYDTIYVEKKGYPETTIYFLPDEEFSSSSESSESSGSSESSVS